MDSGRNLSQLQFKILAFAYFTIAAIGVVHIGNDNGFRELLRIPSYYSDLLVALGLSYGFGYYISRVSKWVLKQFVKVNQFQRLLFSQFLWGVVPPFIFGALSLAAYLYFGLGMSLSESSMFYLELPLRALFLAIGNGLHLGALIQKYRELIVVEYNTSQPVPAIVEAPALEPRGLMVSGGAQSWILDSSEIAWVILEEKTAFIRTFGGKQFMDMRSLDQIYRLLGEADFYQINRQFIANRASIKGFESTETRRLKMELEPQPESPQFVSKARAGSFTQWLKMASE